MKGTRRALTPPLMGSACLHCHRPIADKDAPDGYCCAGCATVAALLRGQGLDRYYTLQGGATAPVALPARPHDLAWLEQPLMRAMELSRDGIARLEIDIQGIRCSACVWLICELLRRRPGGLDAVINPALGRASLTFRSDVFDAPAWIRELERFGYVAGLPRKSPETPSDALLLRLGICVALTMNSMMFSIAHYLGMTSLDTDVFPLMRWLNFLLTAAVVFIGGGEFFGRAFVGLARGRLSFDLPIAMGLALAFGGSIYVFFDQPGSFSYFDTLNTFTTLMLVGRWLQERVIEQNRRSLLADDGVDGLMASRIAGGMVETVQAAALRKGDEVLVQPGSLLVADGLLADEGVAFSLDWINGESVPRGFKRGETVPAGAFNNDHQAARLVLAQDFAESSLPGLLERPGSDPGQDGPAILAHLTRFYVPAVLSLAAVAFFIWLPQGAARALEVTTSLLVVTCPCAIGLAIPLAYQRTAAALRRRGLFVTRAAFLDRALRVRRVVFDKTGTLTLGTLGLRNRDALLCLPDDVLQLVANMTARSSHPRSRCIRAAVPGAQAAFDPLVRCVETPGHGLEATLPDGRHVRLGAPAWVGQGEGAGVHEVWISVDNHVIARLQLEETLRHDARHEIAALKARGLAVAMLSGDAPDRVAAVAESLGIGSESAVGGLSPQGKAEWLARAGAREDTLLIGDGINDHPGFDEALACGTPAIDHPTLASRADFYFLTSGIGCVRTALDTAAVLRNSAANVRNLALAYNAFSVAACLSGIVSPVAAAIAMPSSSILILLYTMRSTSFAGGAAGAVAAEHEAERAWVAS